MALKTYKPITPSLRQLVIVDRTGLWKGKPVKELTRGTRVSREGMQAFVATLEIPQAAKAELLKLTPWEYTGKAAELAKRI